MNHEEVIAKQDEKFKESMEKAQQDYDVKMSRIET
jgi:hypothetical protein